MLFWQVASIAGCMRSFILVHWILVFLATPARTINKTRLNFSTLYTSIPHDLLKSRISNLVHNAFRKKDGSVRYTHIKVTRAKGYFTHDINGGGDNMYTADNICKMIEFLIDNISQRDISVTANC